MKPLPASTLSSQSLTMELAWVSAWFGRLLALDAPPGAVFFADRSPFSAVFYAAHGRLLEPVIHRCVDELATAGIHILTACLHTEPETLWRRIRERLVVEPERALYGEADRAWMDTTAAFYAASEWDFTVDNTATPVADTVSILLRAVEENVADFDAETARAVTPRAGARNAFAGSV